MLETSSIVLPKEFVFLLKCPTPSNTSGASILSEAFRNSQGLVMVLDRAFKEFNEHGLALDKVLSTLGWEHFRDRLASVYVFRALHGGFPDKTSMELVDEIIDFEKHFQASHIAGSSRLFMLGFYLKLLNIHRNNLGLLPLTIPSIVSEIIGEESMKSDRMDWLVLMVWHMHEYFGDKALKGFIKAKTPWSDLYQKLQDSEKKQLVLNLLAYGSSVGEDDIFLHERI